MQSSASAVPQPEAILEWLEKEMSYQPQGKYANAPLPSVDSLRKVCRGNMVPVFNFLLRRVKSEKTVEKIRRNILVHGSRQSIPVEESEVKDSKGRRKDRVKAKPGSEKTSLPVEGSTESCKEISLKERDLKEQEVQRLRAAVQRRRKELKAKMIEVAKDEAERKRMIEERANYRHRQVMLEAYSQQCNEAVKILAQYEKRLHSVVNQARDVRKSGADKVDFSRRNSEKALYSTVKSNKSSDGLVLIETALEKNIRQACEALAARMLEKVRCAFPAYDGTDIHLDSELEASKISFEFDGELPDEVRAVITSALKNPPQLLEAITSYTSRMKTLIRRETEKVDIRADAERLRYRFENNRITDVASPEASSSFPYHMHGIARLGSDILTKGIGDQLLERQKAHVQQFIATEDGLNKAAEARKLSQILIKRLHGRGNDISPNLVLPAGAPESTSNLGHSELDVWAKEREAAGMRACVDKLTFEVQRLEKQCEEWKEAEYSLRKRWKKIEEFDARRSELQAVYLALLRANEDAVAFWNEQPIVAKEYASATLVPACTSLADIAVSAKDLTDKEASIFSQCPDNSFYMLPSFSQALIESMGVTGSTGVELAATAEKRAAFLIARAGAGDPSAVPSICRVSSALHLHHDTDASHAGLASVLGALEFCLKPRGSEASILEDLWRAISQLHSYQDLVEHSHKLLNYAQHVQQKYERTANYCVQLATEQERDIMERWVPEVKTIFMEAQKCLENCQRVRGLVDEWWKQPAATVVDWVTVDGKNVSAWLNYVKQLQMTFYEKEIL